MAVCSACGAEMDLESPACFHCGHAHRTPPLKKGQVIAGRYELISVLGRGGMGTVYEAHDRSLDERVALKVLSETARGSADADRRFRAEIKLARKIRHPNVCAIHEYGELADLQYIVMELVSGEDLKRRLRSVGHLPPAEAVDFARQIGEGLQAIHEAGVIHRDLKLSNVMIDRSGRVRLMDFGIAKGMGDTMATVTGQILGTPEYMSPEQVQGKPVDQRADIYALGIMTFELLTGRVPFTADTPLATIMLHVHEPPRLDAPSIPRGLVPVLARALAKERGDRYDSAHAFVGALSAASLSIQDRAAPTPSAPRSEVATVEMTTPTPAPVRARAFGPAPVESSSQARRRRWSWAIGGAGLTAIVLGVLARNPMGAGFETKGTPTPDLAPLNLVASTPQQPVRDAVPTPSVVVPVTPPASEATPAASPKAQRSLRPDPKVPPASLRPTLSATGTKGGEAEPVSSAETPPLTASPAPPAFISAAPAPSPTPVAISGLLELAVTPYAEVTVDGRDVGTPPFRPLELSVGRHVVRFVHPSYQPLQRIINIRQGETMRLLVDWSLDGIAR